MDDVSLSSIVSLNLALRLGPQDVFRHPLLRPYRKVTQGIYQGHNCIIYTSLSL